MIELMLRLVKDGKIVGYGFMGDCGMYYYRNEFDGYGTDIECPEYDHKDPGIKVAKESGDEWWFAGDIVVMFSGTREFAYGYYFDCLHGINTHGWYLRETKSGDCIPFQPLDTHKRIGSIYDKEGANG